MTGEEWEELYEQEWKENYRSIVRAKWTIDGATTLREASEKAHAFADYLAQLDQEGWVLESMVEEEYGYILIPEKCKTYGVDQP